MRRAGSSSDPLVCLARGRSEQDWAPDPATSLVGSRLFGPAERRLRADGLLDSVLDVNESLCTELGCQLSSDGVYTFAASNHLTLPFTLQQAEAIKALLDELVD